MTGPRLHLVPVAFADARALVTEHHRHHRAPGRYAQGVLGPAA